MKKIGLSQRVDYFGSYRERRESLDQNWFALITQLGYLPVPLANLAASQAESYLQQLSLDGILLSGGNSLSHLQADAQDLAPERDAFESALLQACLKQNKAVVGICRGMQLINHQLGGKLCAIKDHINVRHSIHCQDETIKIPLEVNSFHQWGITADELSPALRPIACDNQGYIEAFIGREINPLLGLMWHPEREQPFNPLDLALLKKVFS